MLALEATRTLCLPSAMWGPFCSVPPVGTMTVVLPAAMRSRTSSQVSCSRKTVSGTWADAAPAKQNVASANRYRIMIGFPFYFAASQLLALIHFDTCCEQLRLL